MHPNLMVIESKARFGLPQEAKTVKADFDVSFPSCVSVIFRSCLLSRNIKIKIYKRKYCQLC